MQNKDTAVQLKVHLREVVKNLAQGIYNTTTSPQPFLIKLSPPSYIQKERSDSMNTSQRTTALEAGSGASEVG
jgi:hypothetical protein